MVTAPARLHFGFVNLGRGMGRRFGGAGLSITGVANEFVFTASDEVSIEADDGVEFDVERDTLAAMVESYGRHINVSGGVRIRVKRMIPRHQGLGSGTQLALTLGHGIGRLHGREVDSRGIAKFFGRGARSGVGIATFDDGGLIADGGKRDDDELPTVIAREEWPEEWRIVLVFDRGMSGLHGRDEQRVFESLPEWSEGTSGRLSDVVLKRLMPSAAARDFDAVAAAIAEMQEAMGEHFKEAQGGCFTSPAVRDALQGVREGGVVGIGQSSWGPTGFALCRDAAHAESVKRALETAAAQSGVTVQVVSADNGAERVRVDERA